MSFKAYPVIHQNEKCEEYTVKINGIKVETDICKVSKEPFNRRRPGHQRQIEQSELASFLSLESEIVYHEEYSAGGKIRSKNRNIIFKNIRLYGSQKIRIYTAGFDNEHKCADILIDGLHKNGVKINTLD